jgi:hypothetical protein
MTGGVAGFALRYPKAWHVIEAEGAGCETLYPAAMLRRLAGLPADHANRHDFQCLDAPGGGSAVLRPQLMRDEALTPTLAGVFLGRPDLWRDHINQHVFFWVTPDRRDRFINACVRLRGKGVNARAPVVIEIATASLPVAHIFFSLINSGSAIWGGGRAQRDETTLRPLHSWHGERVAELAIRGPVPLATDAFRSVRTRVIEKSG